MRVLVACETSGIVRDAFLARGHDAWSCDLQPTDAHPKRHIRGNAALQLEPGRWDLLIAHPPCTHLSVSGARWFPYKEEEQAAALAFVKLLLEAPVPRIALENPVSIISTKIRKPDQIIQPWQFGHKAKKTTCLWLKGLPALVPTKVEKERSQTLMQDAPSLDRAKRRSQTYTGIALAMAAQWGSLEN